MKQLKAPAGIKTVLRNLFKIEDGYAPNRLATGPAIPMVDAAAGQVVFAFIDPQAALDSDPLNLDLRFRCASTNTPFDMRPWDPLVATFGTGARADGTGASFLPRGWFWKLDFLNVTTGVNDPWQWVVFYVDDNTALGVQQSSSWQTQAANTGLSLLNNGTARDGMVQLCQPGRWGMNLNRSGGY